MKNVLVIAPHPDDETLGCGGTLLRHRASGDNIHWLIVTDMKGLSNWTQEMALQREKEINNVSHHYRFDSVTRLEFPTTRLDTVSLSDIISKMKDVFIKIEPNIVYLPYPGDAHTDHHIVFQAAVACTKWFRHPYIQRILVYETVSETDFGIDPVKPGFRPNVFVNIEEFLDTKIAIMKLYANEVAPFPFPRSEQVIRSLALLRGAASGCQAAEAFMLLKEIL